MSQRKMFKSAKRIAHKLLPLWYLRTLWRSLFEKLGFEFYSRPSAHQIQNFMEENLGENGFFVEAGALDGVFESNTYYLEKFRNWHGILIEPLPQFYRRIRINRPQSQAFNCALVSNEYLDSHIAIHANHAFSAITDTAGSEEVIAVEARTLTSVLDEANPPEIDLLSLDVEGYENQVLNGLDLQKYRPKFIIIECLTSDKKKQIDETLSGKYLFLRSLTHRDMLYIRNSATVKEPQT